MHVGVGEDGHSVTCQPQRIYVLRKRKDEALLKAPRSFAPWPSLLACALHPSNHARSVLFVAACVPVLPVLPGGGPGAGVAAG